MSQPMPRELATPKETFDQLAADFRLDSKVPETIVKLGCQSLSDFRYYVHDESELQASVLDQHPVGAIAPCLGCLCPV